MTGKNEKQGTFYVVSDFTYKYMQNDWGTIGSDQKSTNQSLYW